MKQIVIKVHLFDILRRSVGTFCTTNLGFILLQTSFYKLDCDFLTVLHLVLNSWFNIPGKSTVNESNFCLKLKTKINRLAYQDDKDDNFLHYLYLSI